MIIIIVVSSDHIIFFCYFAFQFADQVVEVVNLLVQIGVVLPDSWNLFIFIVFEFLDCPILILKYSEKLIIFSDATFLVLVHHF